MRRWSTKRCYTFENILADFLHTYCINSSILQRKRIQDSILYKVTITYKIKLMLRSLIKLIVTRLIQQQNLLKYY